MAGSSPLCTATSVGQVEDFVRDGVTSFRPAPVVAELIGEAWLLRGFVQAQELREITRAQGRKYEAVRAGELAWSSTMRPVPPESETRVVTVHLG